MPPQPYIPLSEEFTNKTWTHYTSFDEATREQLPFQHHVDIRSFTETLPETNGGDFLAPEKWELPAASTVGPQAALSHFPALKLKTIIGAIDAVSTVEDHPVDLTTGFLPKDLLVFSLPSFPLASVNTAASYIELIESDWTIRIPFNKSTSALIAGDCHFSIPIGNLNQVFFRNKPNPLPASPSPAVKIREGEWRQPLQAHMSFGNPESEQTDLTKIVTVKFHIVATAATTVYIAGLRVIAGEGTNPETQPGWRQSTVDFDNWNGRLRKPTSLAAPTKAPDIEQSIIWKSNVIESPTDPMPIDTEYGIVFNTGSQEATNSFTMYFRQESKIFNTMLDLIDIKMAELDGQPQPDLGTKQFNPRTIAEFDADTMEEIDVFDMEEMERLSVPNPVLESWVYFTLSCDEAQPTITMGNNSGLSFNFVGLEGLSLEEHHDYYVVFTLEGSTARARLFDLYQTQADGGIEEVETNVWEPTDKYFAVKQEPLFDSTVINDDNIFRRRKGRLGWSASFEEADFFVRSMRPRGITFSEYESATLTSHTPVIGASLFASMTPDNTSLWEGEFDLYPEQKSRQHAVLTLDRARTTIKNGFSYKVSNKGVPRQEEYQGLHTEFMSFTDWDQTQIEFNLWYNGPAREKEKIITTYHGFYPGPESYPGPERYPGETVEILTEPTLASIIARLESTDGTVIPLPMPELETRQWQHIVLRMPVNDIVQTGYYQLQILQQTRLATNWWVDGLKVLQRAVEWSARAVTQDPWGGTYAPWTQFENIINDKEHHSGILLEPRGKELQMRGRARRQDVQIQRPEIIPRYAQLGRLVWPEEEFHGESPTAKFKAEPEPSHLVKFTDESTVGSGVIVSKKWEFGDGARFVDNADEVEHTYPASGTFVVTLTTTDRYGQSDSEIQEVEVL